MHEGIQNPGSRESSRKEEAPPISFSADIIAFEKHYTAPKLFPNRFDALSALADFISEHGRDKSKNVAKQNSPLPKKERSRKLRMLVSIGRKSSAFMDMMEAETPWVHEVVEWAVKHSREPVIKEEKRYRV